MIPRRLRSSNLLTMNSIITMTELLSIQVKMIPITMRMSLLLSLNLHLAALVLWTTLVSSATMMRMSIRCKMKMTSNLMTIMKTNMIPSHIVCIKTHSRICTDTIKGKRGPKKISRRRKVIMRKITTKLIRLHRLMLSHTRHSRKIWKIARLNLYLAIFRGLCRQSKLALRFSIFRWSIVKELT